MVPKKVGLAVVVAIFLLLLVAFRSPEITAAVQKGFVLDLDSPRFPFEEDAFNDTDTSKEYSYNSSGNVTYWVSMPRNSTVINTSLDVTGEIIYIYQTLVTSDGLLGVSVGDVTSDSGNEIVTGTNNLEPTVRVLYGENGSLIWSYDVSSSPNNVLSTATGNVTSDPGNEIVVGEQDTAVYVLIANDGGGSEAWNFSTGGEVKSVALGDVDGGENEVVAGSADGNVYVLDYQGNQIWNFTVDSGTVYSVAVGNLTSDPSNEIAVGADKIYVINSSGDLVWKKDLSTTIFSVAIGDVNDNEGNELAVGTLDNRIYLLNVSDTEANVTWNYSTGGDIKSVIIEDVTVNIGNETVAGSDDGNIYTLDTQGNLVWSYATASLVETVAAGNLTVDPGNEVAAGAINGYLYMFNFDYFPTNLSMDVGANGTADWNYSGSLRGTQTATGLEGGFQYYLDNSCTGDMCDVPILFHSDHAGKLNISGLNISYSYNASSVISYTNLTDTWSRTWNVQVNESIGYEVKNVSFLASPDQDTEVRYIEIPGSASRCDFNGSACQTATVDSKNTCNVPDFTINELGPLPEPFYFWDDSMTSGVPVEGNESGYSYTNETDSFFSSKTINIWNETETTFYNITGNTTVDDSSIRGMLFLNVSWSGQPCNITPQADTLCTQDNPGYSSFTCSGDTFYACKNGSFFRWVQPYSSSGVSYQAGGATNLPADLSNPNVTLNDSIWGDWFNYSILINDTDGDNVSVTLWYWLENMDSWFNGSTINITDNGTAWFNMSSDKDWVGVNKYKFEYRDFNSSGDPMHSSRNTSIYWGPLARKHSTGVVYVSGNESSVNRSESVELVVRINDTDNETWVQGGVSCALWVTFSDSSFDEGNFSSTNSSGYCVFHFTPDGNYSAGNQTWKVGVLDDTYYNDSNSSDFVLTVSGRVNISLTEPGEWGTLYRNSTNYLEAKLVDQYGLDVNQSGFNCSFWFNYTYLNSSNTTEYGRCNISWTMPCGYSRQDYVVNVTLTEPNGSYSILNDMDWRNVSLHDELSIAILEPQEYSLVHKGDGANFNSSVNDTCGLCSPGNYSVNWSVKWKRMLEVTVNKTPGYDEQVFPVIVNASYLEAQNIDIGDWDINYTRVLLDGVGVPSRVNAWNDSSKTAINWSQKHFNNYSELVFLVNQSGWENLTYEVVYNRSDEQEDFSYLENGGFESGLITPWKCFGESCGERYCQCELRQESGELNGSYSLYLSSDDTGGQPHVMGASLKTSRILGQDRIKVRYKPTGEFDTDAYIRLYAGSGMCELDNTTGAWLEDVCFNTSFSSALWVNITVHDTGNGGNEDDASHVYIDYICLANSSGDCVNYHSGYPHPVSSLSETPLNQSDNITWTIPLNESLGLRRVVVNASGDHYKPEVEKLYIYIYGWSNLSAGNISSTNCTYNDTWICRQNASMDMFCYVWDANSSEPIEGHNVSFWGDGVYIGSNTTDSGGVALINWMNSSDAQGNHTIVCNITDGPNTFYNASDNNSAEILFNISSGITTAEVNASITPGDPADSLTKEFNHTYYLDINITNTGQIESMYDVIVEINTSVTSAGIYAETVSCPPVPPVQSCNRTSVINVTYLATEGVKDIHVNVTWTNSDTSQGNASNVTGITVENNTVLNIVESEVNYTMPRGGSALAGNFTVESFGNTGLLTINFSESGGNASQIHEWINYTPSSPIASIPHMGEQLVNITVTVPDNATEGLYTANITVNATGSDCSPAGLCWDYFVFNLNVTMPDWRVSDTQLNKTIGRISVNGTIGIVQVINNKDADWTFNVTMDDQANGTGNITVSVSNFTLTPFSSFSLEVYHNTTGEYAEGLYLTNITIANNEYAVPQSINVSVSLNVINFSIAIVSPNQSNPDTDIMPGDILNITANATLSGSPVDENITWYVRVGGVECDGSVQSAYNSSDHLWYINCSAPDLPGNPTNNSLNLTGYYNVSDVSLSVIEEDAVIYRDVTPPQIHDISVEGADFEGNLEYSGVGSLIEVRASITDNKEIESVWAELYYEGSHQSNYSMQNISDISPDTWNFSFSSPIASGDYRVIVYANDSTGNQNDTSSLVMGYFDIYYPIDLNGTLVDKDSVPIEANFSLYKNNTLWKIHSFNTNGTGGYNWVLHRRVYDMKMEFSEHGVLLYGVDINASAVNQHGVEDPDNLTDPITLDLYTAENTSQIGVTLPEGAENPIMVIALEHNLTRVSSNTNFNLDYTQAIQDFYTYTPIGSITESNLGVYRCSNWSMNERSCTGGFQNVSISVSVDTVEDKISFNTSGASAYVVAEWEGVGENGNGDVNGDDGGDGGGGGRTSAGTATTTTLPFTVTTSIGSIRIHPGENKTYLFSVKNKVSRNLTVSLDVQGLGDFIFPEKSLLEIPYNESGTTDIVVSVPDTMGTGTYTGSILVTAAGKTQEIPITMTVSIEAKDLVSISIDILTPNVNPGGKLRFGVELKNLALLPGFNVSLVYIIKDSERERIVSEVSEDIFLEESLVFTKSIEMKGNNPIGQYYLEIWAYFADGKSVNEVAVFNLSEPYWSSWEGRIILLIISFVGMGIIGYYGWRRYQAWRLEKARYIFPLDYRKIPQEREGSFWIGRIAESDKKAWFNPSDLTTHLLIAGSTGAGKSVGASVFVEEALDRNIPVIVFDPTAQWTGFVKALEDQNLLKYYSMFGMDPKSTRPFKGMIFEVTDVQELLFDIKQGFKRYLAPGEITVFTLEKLKPGQYDEAINIIIDALFSMPWEESTTLKVIVVFDEVHRLLEKYGGKGGYVALEKAAREFRKWGIGVIMCSQVLADFKEAIAGNVLTEVQLNTKSITDIQKVETKYGGEYARKISRQGVGVGMIQNPKYNDGKPYFIRFRPTWHNPHKISNKDMEIYREFAMRLEAIEAKIEQFKKAGKDTFDIELELKLAKDKLKQGRFRMAQIYITSLEQHLGKG